MGVLDDLLEKKFEEVRIEAAKKILKIILKHASQKQTESHIFYGVPEEIMEKFRRFIGSYSQYGLEMYLNKNYNPDRDY